MTTMDIISQSLKRSQELIYNLLKDDSLQTLVVNTVNLIPGSEQTSIMSRKSRDAIRSVASKLISDLQSSSVVEETIIDVSEDAVTEVVNAPDENLSDTEKANNKLNELGEGASGIEELQKTHSTDIQNINN